MIIYPANPLNQDPKHVFSYQESLKSASFEYDHGVIVELHDASNITTGSSFQFMCSYRNVHLSFNFNDIFTSITQELSVYEGLLYECG